MKKHWLHGLALSLGLVSASTSHAQYPVGYGSGFGPSSYPVQQQFPGQYQTAPGFNSSSILSSLPQVPQDAPPPAGSGFARPAFAPAASHNIQAQNASFGGNPQEVVPPPAPVAPPRPTPLGSSPANQSSSPYSYNPGYGQESVYQPEQYPGQPSSGQYYPGQAYDGHHHNHGTLAPNCSSCGPAPISDFSFSAPGLRRGHHLAGLPPGARPWFFGGGVLLFHRVDDGNVPLSFADNIYSPDILGTRDARMGVMPGFEVMLGRYFNCGRNAIAASYWGIFSDNEDAVRARTMPGDYRSRLPFNYLWMPDDPRTMPIDPYEVYPWYDNAFTHTLRRSSNYHNVEVNLLGFAMGGAARSFNIPTGGSLFHRAKGGGDCGDCAGTGCGSCGGGLATGPCSLAAPACGSRCNLTWLAGFRYFRFEDNLYYAASLQDSYVTRAQDDLYYDVNTTNDLFGFQIGSRADYCIGRRLNTYGLAKVGIYGNHSSFYSRVGTDYQVAYLDDNRMPTNSSQGQAYLFSESETDVAFLSELGTGIGYRISPKWTATAGYRAVIASGVATSPNNVRHSFANYEDIRDYDRNGTLILHGLNIGALYNY